MFYLKLKLKVNKGPHKYSDTKTCVCVCVCVCALTDGLWPHHTHTQVWCKRQVCVRLSPFSCSKLKVQTDGDDKRTPQTTTTTGIHREKETLRLKKSQKKKEKKEKEEKEEKETGRLRQQMDRSSM